VLCILEMIVRKEHPGWERVMAFSRNACEQPAVKSSPLPALMVGVTLIMIACLMTILAFVNKTDFNVLISFAAVLYLISIVIFLINMQPRKKHE